MKLLLHACCGPCACYPTKVLSEQGVDFTLLYYNPNIHPYKEFKHRLSALRELSEKQDYRLIIDKTYTLGIIRGRGPLVGGVAKRRFWKSTAPFFQKTTHMLDTSPRLPEKVALV